MNAIAEDRVDLLTDIVRPAGRRAAEAQCAPGEGPGAEIPEILPLVQPELVKRNLDAELRQRSQLQLQKQIHQVLEGELIGVSVVQMIGGEKIEEGIVVAVVGITVARCKVDPGVQPWLRPDFSGLDPMRETFPTLQLY